MMIGTVERGTLLSELIEKVPGIRYRELLRITGMANGVLAYHLARLETSDVVKVDRQRRSTRYYPRKISKSESDVIRYLRHEPTREILEFILSHDMCTFRDIVEHTGKARSTVSQHLNRLEEGRVVVSVHLNDGKRYRMANRRLLVLVLSKYNITFVDKIVDNYVEILDKF